MRALKVLPFVLVLGAIPLEAAPPQKQPAITEVVDKIVAQEQTEMQTLRQYSPIVETYIQLMRSDKQYGEVPKSDKYFLGRAELSQGVELEPLLTETRAKRKMFGGVENFFSTEFMPRGFLQMIYIDTNGFDRQNYRFQYVGRAFLGEVRCLVFDLYPTSPQRGRFMGRIWVEDQDFHIVRFNGGYSGNSKTSYYVNFDSWRTNAGKNQWLPSYIYSEEGGHTVAQSFRAQTRLWGYEPSSVAEEQELSKVLIESSNQLKDQSDSANDYSPLEEKREWSRQAEDNITSKLEQLGLMAPPGEVNKVLDTVVNNLEVTNNLDISPEIRCRVLMTSTLESFTVGHTIVLSRGLIDVLPDEPSLAAVLAHELGHVVLGHRSIGTQYAFFNRLRFDERDTFHHFGFTHTPEQEDAATQEGVKLLKNSPYKDQLANAQLFLQALSEESKAIPNLVSPHLGNRLAPSLLSAAAAPKTQTEQAKPVAMQLAALPLGGRVKVEVWDNQLHLLKVKPASVAGEDEVAPFEVTPFYLYLTRQNGGVQSEAATGTASVKTVSEASVPDNKPR
ncbi:MAG TPA: M48 family metalloprotease [Candidatus Acidoferrum sp.]|nr:M48 family metalloprotease [Candidatus Acidoferrum sp.]